MKPKSTDNAGTNKFAQVNENGFLPNSFQTPNAIIDKYGPYLTSDEFRVWIYACRHILGWEDKIASRRRRISLSVFINGYGLFPGCGLNRGAVIQALAGLSKYGLLLKIGEANQAGQMWEIPSKETKIDLPGLVERKNSEAEKHSQKTVKARSVLTQKRAEKEIERSVGQTTTRSVGQTTSNGTTSTSNNDPNTIKQYSLNQQVVCGTDHPDHLNHNTKSYLQENEKLTGGLWDRPKVVCGTDLNKPTSKPKTENNNYYAEVEKFLAQKNFLELAEFWWDNKGAAKWIEIASAKLNCAGQHPGALCGDREHLALAQLLEGNLRSMTIDDFQTRYENYLHSDNYFYFERKYSLQVFCNQFKNLMTPNHAKRKQSRNGNGILNGGPASGIRPGAAVVGTIAKNTRDPFEEYSAGNEFINSLTAEQRQQLEALPY